MCRRVEEGRQAGSWSWHSSIEIDSSKNGLIVALRKHNGFAKNEPRIDEKETFTEENTSRRRR